MKKIFLLMLLMVSIVSSGQKIPLSYTTNTGIIDGLTFPKGSLFYNVSGTSDIKITIANIGAVWGTRPYTDFTYNSVAFPSRDSLTNWLNTNIFVPIDTAAAIVAVGGKSTFIGNGIDSVFNITHNAGFIPSWFTLTTETPISVDQLNRKITFPDANTMRITFTNIPTLADSSNYVWGVFK